MIISQSSVCNEAITGSFTKPAVNHDDSDRQSKSVEVDSRQRRLVGSRTGYSEKTLLLATSLLPLCFGSSSALVNDTATTDSSLLRGSMREVSNTSEHLQAATLLESGVIDDMEMDRLGGLGGMFRSIGLVVVGVASALGLTLACRGMRDCVSDLKRFCSDERFRSTGFSHNYEHVSFFHNRNINYSSTEDSGPLLSTKGDLPIQLKEVRPQINSS